MAWTQTLDQLLLADPGEITFEYTPTKGAVSFFAECPEARPSWKLAARGTCLIPINPLNGATQSDAHYFRILLNQLHTIKGDFLQIRLRVPHWITILRLQIWEDDGELLPNAPLVGEVRQFGLTIAGNSWIDQNGFVWLNLNGSSIGPTGSGAISQGDHLRRLYEALWPTSSLFVNGGRGATAAADWEAGKALWLLDMRGRSPMGAGQGLWLTPRAVGQLVGAETHSLTAAENGSHSHDGTTSSTGGHLHGLTMAEAGSHVHTGTTSNDGVHGHSVNIRRNIPLGDSISAATATQTGTPTGMGTTSSGSHTHTLTINSAGGHTHSLTQDSAGVHSHAVTIAAAGSGSPHNNVHPSTVLSFLIATGEKMP